MKKIAIISDIHGNYSALSAVFAEIDSLQCSDVYFLGDVCGYYSGINECIELLKKRCKIALLGNHDQYMISGESCPRSNSANICLDLQRHLISLENMEWLKTLKKGVFVSGDLSMTHGGWNDPIDEYMYDISEEYFQGKDELFFASGHTHVQNIFYLGNKVYCNPGSVGQPRDGDPNAAFAIFYRNKFELKRVKYNIDKTFHEMRGYGMGAFLAENLYAGTRVGGGISKVGIIRN